jgi:F-type H+-transporting ATPase subunit b
MDETLRQLGQLLLSSIPAIFGLLIVWAAYRVIVYSPLQKVLGERQARTEGAIQQAQAEIASAEERTAEYERRVREARAQIYAGQEARSRLVQQERETILAEARKHADATVKNARAGLEQDVLSAKTALQQQAEFLAQQIIESVLKPAAVVGGR